MDRRSVDQMSVFVPDGSVNPIEDNTAAPPVAVDEADDRDWDIEQIRGQRGDAVASGFGRGIENLVAHHRRKAQLFVVDGHCGRGYENVETVTLCWLDQMQHGVRPRRGTAKKAPTCAVPSEHWAAIRAAAVRWCTITK
jgi:hypothetical protein